MGQQVQRESVILNSERVSRPIPTTFDSTSTSCTRKEYLASHKHTTPCPLVRMTRWLHSKSKLVKNANHSRNSEHRREIERSRLNLHNDENEDFCQWVRLRTNCILEWLVSAQPSRLLAAFEFQDLVATFSLAVV